MSLTDGPGEQSAASVFWRVLSLVRPLAWWMALSVVLGSATIGSSIGLMTTSAYLISRAALQPSIADLQVAVVGVRFFGIARGLLRYLERLAAHETTFRLLARLRVWFYRALEPLAPARLYRFRSGDLLSRIVADVDELQNVFLRVLAPPAVALVVALLASGLMWWLHPLLGVTLLGFHIIAGLGLPFVGHTLGREPGRQMVRVRARFNSAVVEGIQGVADLVAFGGEDRQVGRVAQLGRELVELQGRMARIEGLSNALTGLAIDLAVLVVLVIGVSLVSSGQLEGVYLAVLIMAVLSSFESILPLPQAFQYLDSSLEAARRLFEVVDSEAAVHDPPPDRQSPVPEDPDITIRDLSFAYTPGGPPVLRDISFHLGRGGFVGIVGPSGAGKSTLVSLLLRFWDYEEGQIRVGGRELRHLGQGEWRSRIGVVSQRSHLFNGTIRQNLLLARPAASEEEMIRAAQQAQIHEFAESLPQGYDTWVGEQGLRLSGGQRQRLAIGRAVLRHAPILLLDEPTANLDPLTADALMQTLRPMIEDRTTLIITHRTALVEMADEILVVRRGRVVERGDHDDLLRRDGFYRRMWEAQRRVVALG
jgi:ATP-binding cassette subfamily C protein CydC